MKLFLPESVPIVGQAYTSATWLGFFRSVLQVLQRVAGANVFTVATQPALGVKDAGYLGLAADYGHELLWVGTAWAFAPGDSGNGYYATFAVAPTAAGWALCDGSDTPYLVTGGPTLTTANFTTPTVANQYFRI